MTKMKIKSIFIILVGTATLGMADGSGIFERCAVCHGEHAEKKSLGVSEIIAGWKEDKIIERLTGYKAKKLNQYGFGNMMYGQATKLSDKEMREVAHYISKLTLPQAEAADNNATDEVLSPEQIAQKKFIREYFIANPKYGEIREANRLWEAKKMKENTVK